MRNRGVYLSVVEEGDKEGVGGRVEGVWIEGWGLEGIGAVGGWVWELGSIGGKEATWYGGGKGRQLWGGGEWS